METLNHYDGLQVPAWSLCYLVNGDSTGISDEEQAEVDSWYSQFMQESQESGGDVIFSITDESEYFTWNPDFGLACHCVECEILIVR